MRGLEGNRKERKEIFGRRWRLACVLVLGGLLACVTAVLISRPTRAAGPWYVAPGGDDGNACTTPISPCATINGALAKSGFVVSDTILVASGTYTGTGSQVVLLDESATLSGGWDPAFAVQSGTSIIDGQDARRGVTVGTCVTAVIDHFVIENGSAADGGGI